MFDVPAIEITPCGLCGRPSDGGSDCEECRAYSRMELEITTE